MAREVSLAWLCPRFYWLAAGSHWQSAFLGPEVWDRLPLNQGGGRNASISSYQVSLLFDHRSCVIIDINYYCVQLLRLEVVGNQVWLA